MHKRTITTLVGLLSLHLAGCQPAGTIPALVGQGPAVSAVQQGASLTVTVATGSRLSVLDALPTPQKLSNIAKIDAEVVTSTGASLSPAITASQTSASPTATFTLTGIPAGTGYKIKVTVRDSFDADITQAETQLSTDSFDVANNTATPASITVTPRLLDATGDGVTSGPLYGQLQNGLQALPDANEYGVALLNNRTLRSSSAYLSADTTFRLTQVQMGGGVPGHEIWAYASDGTVAIPAMRFPVDNLQGLSTNDASPTNFALSVNPPGITSPLGNTAVNTTCNLTTDGMDNLYYWETDVGFQKVASDIPQDYGPAGITGVLSMAVTKDGNTLYYAKADGIYKLAATDMAEGTPITGLPTSNIGKIAVDDSGNLYYEITGAMRVIKKAIYANGGFMADHVIVGTPGEDLVTLAVDAYGNVFHTAGNGVIYYKLDYKWAYGMADIALTDAVSNITAMAVDRVGNIYINNGTNIRMLPATKYGSDSGLRRVAGTTTAAGAGVNDLFTGTAAHTVDLLAASQLAVNGYGNLYFLSAGATAPLLRSITPVFGI